MKNFSFSPKTLLGLGSLAMLLTQEVSAEPLQHPPKQSWSFQKMTGTFDRATVQRGLQVYKEVCSVCHSVKRIRFRELAALGFSETEIKAIAAGYNYETLNNEGETVERKGEPSDPFPSPYKNDLAGRAANGGALPLDLSLMAKARLGGPDYIHALLTGYNQTPPKDISIAQGSYYNPFMTSGQIAMSPPITHDAQVTYSDGTKATIDQMSRDVTTFLSWAAEPELEERRRLGFAVVLYLLIMTAVFGLAMRKIWKGVK